MRPGFKNPLHAAIAVAILAAPALLVSFDGGGANQAFAAGPGGSAGAGAAGAGAGNAGNAGAASADGAAASGADGATTAAAATDPNTSGLGTASGVLGTTPADQQAIDSVAAAEEEQATDGTASEDDNGMSFGQAMDNMAEDASAALDAIFGGETQ